MTDCKPLLYPWDMAKSLEKLKPYEAQGNELRSARGRRTFKSVANDLGIQIGRYQNWEYGKNRPDPKMFGKLKEVLHVDCSTLYADAPMSAAVDEDQPLVIKRRAVMELVNSIRADLGALEALLKKPVSNKYLEELGFKKP